jgi:hypothetical protein
MLPEPRAALVTVVGRTRCPRPSARTASGSGEPEPARGLGYASGGVRASSCCHIRTGVGLGSDSRQGLGVVRILLLVSTSSWSTSPIVRS